MKLVSSLKAHVNLQLKYKHENKIVLIRFLRNSPDKNNNYLPSLLSLPFPLPLCAPPRLCVTGKRQVLPDED